MPVAQYIDEILKQRARSSPTKKIFTFLNPEQSTSATMTYAELDRRARIIAAQLQKCCQPGDRAVLVYPPGLEYIAVFFGCLYAGVIAVPVYPPAKKSLIIAMGRIIRDAEPQVILASDPVAQGLAKLKWVRLADLIGLGRCLLPSSKQDFLLLDTGFSKIIGTESLAEALADDYQEHRSQGRDLAYLQYTSGSTGNPKGVMLSYDNLHCDLAYYNSAMPMRPIDQAISWLPQYHNFGLLSSVLAPINQDFCIALMSPMTFLNNPSYWLESIAKYRAMLSGGPLMGYQLCVQEIDLEQMPDIDLSCWHYAAFGGEPCRQEVLDAFEQKFNRYGLNKKAFVNGYGMAETTCLISTTRWGSPPLCVEKQGQCVVSCGRPYGEVKIVKNGVVLTEGDVGEIWVKADNVAQGYWQKPEVTKEAFVNAVDGQGPYLRTGDLGFIHGGELYVTGRIKELIIIYGRNFYPQDIAASAQEADAVVTQSVAFADASDRLIVLTEVKEPPASTVALTQAIRKSIAEDHGIQAHKIVLVEDKSLPRTGSNKLQIFAAKQAYSQGKLAVIAPAQQKEDLITGTPPTTAVEKALCEIWAEVLEVDPKKIGINSHFLELGGDSLLAARVTIRLQQTFHADIPISKLLAQPTIAEMASLLAEYKIRYEPIAPAPESADYPMSSQQKRLFLLDKIQRNTAYNIPVVIRLGPEFDFARFQQALDQVIAKHDAFRTSFAQKEGAFVQKVQPSVHCRIEVQSTTMAQLEQTITNFIQPFDLALAPLLRIKVLQTQEGDSLLAIDIHHSIIDGVSMTLLLRELQQAYSGHPLQPASKQYVDYALWQQKQDTQKAAAYWLQELSGELSITEIPTDYKRPAIRQGLGDTLRFCIPKRKVKALCQQYKIRLYNLLLGAFAILLHKYSRQQTVIIGSPVANRTHPDTATIIGVFTNTLVLKLQVTGSLADFFAHVDQKTLSAQDHQNFQFEELAEKLDTKRDVTRNPLFDTLFVLQNIPIDPLTFGERYDYRKQTAQFDLSLEAIEQEQAIVFHLEYSTELYALETAERLIDSYQQIITAITADFSQTIADISVINQKDKHLVLDKFNATDAPYPEDKLVHQLFEEQVAKTPNNVAITFEGRDMTYDKLNKKANQLAHYLRKKHVQPEEVIVLVMERSFEMVIAILGVLKAGGAYLPVEPTWPEERRNYIIKDACPKLVISNIGIVGSVDINDVLSTTEQYHNLPPSTSQLIYIMYTSGSTGKPKGVCVEHRGVINYIFALQCALNIQPRNTLSLTAYTFDVFGQELYQAIFAGAKLILLSAAERNDPVKVDTALKQYNVDFFFITPYFLAELLEVTREYSGQVGIGGERLPIELAKRAQAVLGEDAHLINLYGPTETSIFSSYYHCAPQQNYQSLFAIPIGVPMANTKIYILDPDMQLQPIGAVGEIHIGGAGVARGYLNRPDLTANSFVKNPFGEGRIYKTGDLGRWQPGGNIEYLGRVDFQVKIRGLRIEMGEIEAALLSHPEIEEVVVITQEQKLIAYFSTGKEERIDIIALRSYLAAKLPKYMVPHAFAQLDTLPLNVNGKIDRKALPRPDWALSGLDYVPPTTVIEKQLVAIWAEVLRLDKDNVGINNDFFDLGGDSLLAIRIVAETQKQRLHLSIADILKYGNIKQLAAHCQRLDSSAHATQTVLTGSAPLLPMQVWFLNRKLESQAMCSQHILIALDNPCDYWRLRKALGQLIKHHDALRFHYQKVGAQWQQYYNPISKKTPLERCLITGKDSKLLIEQRLEFIEQTLGLVENALLVRAVLFEGADEQKLLIVAHSLIVDDKSWPILLQDLSRLLNGRSLPEKTTSYRYWGNKLLGYAQSKEIKHELGYWKKQDLTIGHFPQQRSRADGTEGCRSDISLALSQSATTALLKSCPQGYNTTTKDLLLVALIQAYFAWSGNEVLIVNVEDEGRSPLFADVDLSRTVGCFTTVYPVRLRFREGFTPLIREVKETLRKVPNKGLGYGILIEGSDNKKAMPSLSNISFRYTKAPDACLGSLQRVRGESFSGHSPQCYHGSTIDLAVMTDVNSLRFNISYAPECYEEREITAFATGYQTALVQTIEHCRDKAKNSPSCMALTQLQTHLVSTPDKRLICLRQDDSDILVLALPSILGLPNEYRSLFEELDIACQAYSTNKYNVLETSLAYSDISQLADSIIEDILNLDLVGKKVYLLGYSFGAIVALSIAQKLKIQGRAMPLIVVDRPAQWQPYGPYDSRGQISKEALYAVFVNICALLSLKDPRVDFDFVWDIQELSSEAEAVALIHKLLIWNDADIDIEETRKAFALVNRNHKMTYSPNTETALDSITVIKARESKILGVDVTWGWQQYSYQPLEVWEVSGDHFTVLRQPNVKEIARIVKRVVSPSQRD